MEDHAGQSGKLEDLREGYVLRWGPTGLEIQVTEYHLRSVKISWDRVFELAKRSGWRPPKSERPAGD